jgi:spore germination protein YaaH
MKNIRKIFLLLFVFILLFSSSIQSSAKPRKTKLPYAPSKLYTSTVTDSEITINWSSVRKVSGYNLYMAEQYDSNHNLINSSNSTSYTILGLKENTDYWFFVRSYNYSGESADSMHIKVTTKASQVIVEPPIEEIIPEEPIVPIDPTTSKEVLGFTTYYYNGDKSSLNSMVNNTAVLDSIATVTYSTDGQGNIFGLIPAEQIIYARENNIELLALISNNFSGSIGKTLLESSQNRTNLINNILNELENYKYKGVNIDLEGIYASNREHYTTFMSELYNKLNPLGYIVTASVPAKTSDNPNFTWSAAYDYSQISKYTDKIAIMTYDEHYPGGTPGPVASINWVQQVIDYAVTVIPKEKILLGTAAYGYDWSENGTKAYGINGIYNLAANNNAEIKWDSVSQTPYFNYTDSLGVYHSVWFENSTSLAYKLDVVNTMDLKGIAIWRLGLEDEDYWTTIKTKLNK